MSSKLGFKDESDLKNVQSGFLVTGQHRFHAS